MKIWCSNFEEVVQKLSNLGAPRFGRSEEIPAWCRKHGVTVFVQAIREMDGWEQIT